MLTTYDNLSNLVTFKHYLLVNNLNDTIIDYAANNGININYSCIITKLIDETHHIITSSRNDNMYRYITLVKENVDCNRIITNVGNETIIRYENINLKLHARVENLVDLEKIIEFFVETLPVNTKVQFPLLNKSNIDLLLEYPANTDTSIVEVINNLAKINLLSLDFNVLNTIVFAASFNNIVPQNSIPLSVKHVTFTGLYNQPISEGVLPELLQTLKFIGKYNTIIKPNVLPEGLKCLSFFDCEFNQLIMFEGVAWLPRKLKSLFLGSMYRQAVDADNLPKSLHTFAYTGGTLQFNNKNNIPNVMICAFKYPTIHGIYGPTGPQGITGATGARGMTSAIGPGYVM
jgi:hypothetical protein